MTDTSITAVVFDIGNVLLTWNPADIFFRLFGRTDFDTHPLSFLIGNDIWLDMDRGIISKEEAVLLFGRSYPEERETIAAFLDAVPHYITPRDSGIRCAEECKKRGYKIFLLSNFPGYAFKKIRQKYPFFSTFNGGIISYQVHMIKPEEAIYRELLNRYHLHPAETLFIDDRKENISAAQSLGMTGIHLDAHKNIRTEVERVLENRKAGFKGQGE